MQMELFGLLYPGAYKIGNKELRRWVFPAKVTTKLVGTLTSQDMRADAWLSWVPFDPTCRVLYSRQTAIYRALDWVCGIAIPGLLALHILSPRLTRKTMIQGCLSVIALGAIVGWIRHATTETTNLVYGGGPYQAYHDFDMLDACLRYEISNWTNDSPITEDKCLALLNKDFDFTNGVRNPFSRQPLRCEPTAGNITFRHSTNGETVFWYDVHAIPHEEGTFRSK